MSTYIDPFAMGSAVTSITTRVTSLIICEGPPADATDAAEKRLASTAIDESFFTQVEGDLDNMKWRVDATHGYTYERPGNPTHVALIDEPSEVMRLAVPFSNPQPVQMGEPAQTDAFYIAVINPTIITWPW